MYIKYTIKNHNFTGYFSLRKRLILYFHCHHEEITMGSCSILYINGQYPLKSALLIIGGNKGVNVWTEIATTGQLEYKFFV